MPVIGEQIILGYRGVYRVVRERQRGASDVGVDAAFDCERVRDATDDDLKEMLDRGVDRLPPLTGMAWVDEVIDVPYGESEAPMVYDIAPGKLIAYPRKYGPGGELLAPLERDQLKKLRERYARGEELEDLARETGGDVVPPRPTA